MRYVPFIALILLTALLIFLSATVIIHFIWPVLITGPLTLLGFWDIAQTRHSLLRNYPVISHMRWMFEGIRPEIRQYFGESDTGGTPFDRETRTLVYERAKDSHGEMPFGTELNVYEPGHEWFLHSIAPKPAADHEFRVRIGGSECKRPYDISRFNVSAMSFGALSSNAIRALNKGAALGGFAHDTGEGGLTKYHLENGGDLIWEIGSGYFGCRTPDGKFDPEQFKDKVNVDSVKAVHVKVSQGAKPGLGGVMPGAKVTQEIADIRGVPVGVKCVSPPYHTAFSTPRGLIEFVAQLRGLADGRPSGFKLCIGQEREFLAVCKAMIEMDVYPDFITVDGAEGGTGAAPLEFEDHVGTPLTHGLMFVQNALVGTGLRNRIKVGCSGKVTSGFEMARRITQGADYCNAARGMMFAIGCIQAQRCQTNRCPVGVATQDPRRSRGLVVSDKAERVHQFHDNTIASFHQIVAAIGLDSPDELEPSLLMRRIDRANARSYAEIYEWLEPGELVAGSDRPHWKALWDAATPDSFR